MTKVIPLFKAMSKNNGYYVLIPIMWSELLKDGLKSNILLTTAYYFGMYVILLSLEDDSTLQNQEAYTTTFFDRGD